MNRRDNGNTQRKDVGEMRRNVLRSNILVWTGILVSVATMLFSSWLSVLPLVLLALALSIMASRGQGINYRLLAFLLGLVAFLVAVFVFATIPPLYLSWIAFFGFLFVLSARNTKTLVVFIILLFVILPLLVAFRDYLTVSTYNIVRVGSPAELKTLFNNTGSVVLVGHAMADAIAHTQLSPNEMITEWEEVVINGTPYWIFAVTPLNTIAQNYVSKLILVDVQTGETKAIPVHMSVGSGLWLTNSIELRSFLLSSQPIGNTYPFIHGGKPYFAACVNRLANLGLSEYPGEVYVYDQDGNLRRSPQFSGDMSMPENYDWKYLDWYVGKWLYYLSSLSPVSHSFFSRGFLWIPASQYSQDLLNMTLLLPGRSGDTVRVYFGVSPNNPNSIVSIIIANNTGVYYYDVKTLGIYSPYYVQSLVQAKLPAISGGHLYSKYAQLVYSNGYLWVVPIYAQTDVVSLWGLALVNATSPSEMSIYQYSPSYGSYKDFLAMALSLGTVQAGGQICEAVTGNVTRVLQFVYKGDTYLVLEVNGKLLYATPDIGIQEFTRLLTVKTGDQVKLCVSDDRIVQVIKP
ncbi:MAG: hypothetical protein JHC26_05015 [Thermofilum sp.]|jgi:hypothetical protein|uniref:hypothetical protein n=1 Tax=Thermofilum sp. TaxID=1961369 RepID=UPI00258816CD|nr:hypothetical protein [Thermofilum sp.]MCI4408430.1 hypothetical protein [Thermofilum sp.]